MSWTRYIAPVDWVSVFCFEQKNGLRDSGPRASLPTIGMTSQSRTGTFSAVFLPGVHSMKMTARLVRLACAFGMLGFIAPVEAGIIIDPFTTAPVPNPLTGSGTANFSYEHTATLAGVPFTSRWNYSNVDQSGAILANFSSQTSVSGSTMTLSLSKGAVSGSPGTVWADVGVYYSGTGPVNLAVGGNDRFRFNFTAASLSGSLGSNGGVFLAARSSGQTAYKEMPALAPGVVDVLFTDFDNQAINWSAITSIEFSINYNPLANQRTQAFDASVTIGEFMVTSAVPEPSAAVLLVIGGTLAMAARRCRR